MVILPNFRYSIIEFLLYNKLVVTDKRLSFSMQFIEVLARWSSTCESSGQATHIETGTADRVVSLIKRFKNHCHLNVTVTGKINLLIEFFVNLSKRSEDSFVGSQDLF